MTAGAGVRSPRGTRLRGIWPASLALVLSCLPALASAQAARTLYGLSFGTFIPPAAGLGSVTIAATPGGARQAAGGVWLLGLDPGSPAQLLLDNAAGRAFSVQLPADGELVLSNGDRKSVV